VGCPSIDGLVLQAFDSWTIQISLSEWIRLRCPGCVGLGLNGWKIEGIEGRTKSWNTEIQFHQAFALRGDSYSVWCKCNNIGGESGVAWTKDIGPFGYEGVTSFFCSFWPLDIHRGRLWCLSFTEACSWHQWKRSRSGGYSEAVLCLRQALQSKLCSQASANSRYCYSSWSFEHQSYR